jgi:L-malate glycosyltransferase
MTRPGDHPPTIRSRDRVLLVDLAVRYGGTEARVLHLATTLAERGADVLVACLADGMLLPRLLQAGVRCAPLRRGRADPRILWELYRIVRRHRADVVDTHGVHSQFWGQAAALLARVPAIVVTVHSDYAEEQAGLRRAKWYERVLLSARRTRAVYLAVSEPVRRYLVQAGIPEERITLIWNAVPRPPEDLADRTQVRAELGLGDDDFALLTVARLHRSKGHRYLVEALAELRDELPQLRWLIVGEGKEEVDIARRAAESGVADRIELLGFRDDVPSLVRACDAFVFPSLAEGLPLAVLEAAWQGAPVLATTVGGLPHVFADGELSLVPPADPGALAERLRRLARDPAYAEEIGRTGCRVTRDRLSTEVMIDETLAVYDSARARGRTRVAAATIRR